MRVSRIGPALALPALLLAVLAGAVMAGGLVPPGEPDGFSAQPVNDTYHVLLTWQPSPGATYYLLQRRWAGTSWAWEYLPSVAGAQTFTDTTTSCGTYYEYRIRACTEENECSAWVGPAGATAAPCAPNVDQVAPISGRYAVRVRWGVQAGGVTTFTLQRRHLPLDWTYAISLPAGAGSLFQYEDEEGLTCEGNYAYRLRSHRDGAYGPFGDPSEPVMVAPCAPQNLQATALQGQYGATLGWQDVGQTETAYQVKRTWAGGQEVAATLPADSIAYTESGLAALCSQVVAYQVQAGRDGVYSPAAEATAHLAPCAPSDLAFVHSPPYTVSLTWLDNAPDESAFGVWRRLAGESWEAWARVPASPGTGGLVRFTDGEAPCERRVYYRVRAERDAPAANWSDWSEMVTVDTGTCPPGTPTPTRTPTRTPTPTPTATPTPTPPLPSRALLPFILRDG
ncbi:MAG: fibronectin type III domain-containing protein [Anaerolineae bacterium]|nr:fibronectin type III domain-containing protein [Anaerolineae bacterium]